MDSTEQEKCSITNQVTAIRRHEQISSQLQGTAAGCSVIQAPPLSSQAAGVFHNVLLMQYFIDAAWARTLKLPLVLLEHLLHLSTIDG